jgi:hypothetical protein
MTLCKHVCIFPEKIFSQNFLKQAAILGDFEFTLQKILLIR